MEESRNEKVLKNMKLIYQIVKNLGIRRSDLDYEDIVSIGVIGLIKAVNTFDKTKKFEFSTYASRCIKNEIFMSYRANKKWNKNISMYSPIFKEENNEILLMDVIENKDKDVLDEIINKEKLNKVMSIILNYLQAKERTIMFYNIGKKTQLEIAENLGLSQSYVSRKITEIKKQIRKVYFENTKYIEKFFIEIQQKSYKVTYRAENSDKIKQIYKKLMEKSIYEKENFEISIICSEINIILQVPADIKMMLVISKFVNDVEKIAEEI